MDPFTLLLLGGGAYFLYIMSQKRPPKAAEGSASTWKPMLNPSPLPYGDLDTAAQVGLGPDKGDLGISFGITRPSTAGMPEAMLATGKVDNVYIQDGVRKWRLRFLYGKSDKAVVGPPKVGDVFVIEDRHIYEILWSLSK